MSEDKRYKELLTKRSSIKGQITKFKNYLTSMSTQKALNSIQITELTLKLAKFEVLSLRFDELQNELEVLVPSNIEAEIEERECIESDIITNIATAKNLLEAFSIKHECERRRSSCHDVSCCSEKKYELGFQLPLIQINKFDGSYFRWTAFRDTFTSMIHNNERIPPINKFHYLLSYLEGDAARLLSNLEVSSDNYPVAWDLLYNRFNNKRTLINHHLTSLFNIRPLSESERSLKFLIDHIRKNLRALDSLDQPTDKWDVLIIFMVSPKLDSNTRTKWEEHRKTLKGDTPTLDQFYEFLQERAEVLENLMKETAKSPISQLRFAPPGGARPAQTSSTKSFTNSHNEGDITQPNNNYTCIICKDSHRIYDCPLFRAKSVDDRIKDVGKFKLCGNCLRQGHSVNECRLGPCHLCKRKHNSLLHRPAILNNYSMIEEQIESIHAETLDDYSNEPETMVNNSNDHETIANFSKSTEPNQIVLLSTAIIEVSNPSTHQRVKVRALLDCGSQSSFITESLKNKLSLKSNSIDCLKVIGIGNVASNKVIESCSLQIKSINTNYQIIFSCLVLQELTGYLPKSTINVQALNIPTDLQLADPSFYKPSSIDVLIGADLFWDLLGNEQRSVGPTNTTKLRNTQLGWIISGPIPSVALTKGTHCAHVAVSSSSNDNIDNMLTKFWDLEDIPNKPISSQNDQYCEKHFLAHTIREPSGRFCVRLPMKENPDCLGDTYQIARKRFISLENRFKKNPTLKLEYTKFIDEYEQLGHLTRTNKKRFNICTEPHYYLAHFAILKQESESTKLRVVYDGSVPSTSGFSLNDILRAGPNVQDSLLSILLRARQYKFLLTADVEKMYRQVKVSDLNCNLQLILWRESESQPLQTLRLNTLTYGTASASYLSTRCLWQLGEEQSDESIKTIIQHDFFVDDLITGCNDPLQLKYIQQAVYNTLRSGCFNLRKFKSNYVQLFDDLPNKQDNLIISESSSTLGLGWTPSNDTFHFPLKGIDNHDNQVITKRFIMSNAFKIFDPLGILSPIVIIPKIMLQSLWKQKVDWDQPVPQTIKEEWLTFINNIKYLSSLQIPRYVLVDSPKFIELHSFSDASNSAFGACIYIKSTGQNGDVTVKLLCAKSKVCPVKPTTIPRLELCAALLAARLTKYVLDSIRYRPDRCVHWCDSSVVLSWIRNDLSKLKTFVCNRIYEITQLTDPGSWRYVPTDQNPADLISRGASAAELMSMDLWWHGPAYLLKSESEWPILKVNHLDSVLPEIKSHSVVINAAIINLDNYSSFNKIQRVFAYVLRFIHNLKTRGTKRVGILTAGELRDSFHALCVISQRQSFPVEHELLSKGKPLASSSKILSLSPFMDCNKLIRVGGRIDASIYAYEKKHPILLHASHRLTKLYFIQQHEINMHAGPQLLLATAREIVWPVDGRRLARRTVNNCVRCRRLRAKTLTTKMGDLPAQRINPGFPFLSVGLDYAGPFHILNRKGRGSRLIKCYLCLFVCLRYKCLHLEAVSDLTKDAFIMTLRRFVARRGKPTEIFSDNGRNFVAASKEIGLFLNQCSSSEPLANFASSQGIQFKFIPSFAPHFGGIWESGIKSAKHHIKRVVGNSHLTFEEISTLFAQVEAILNSRPLCPLSSRPDDLLSLSPGHFIIGRPLNALPAQDLTEINENRLQRYLRLEKIRQHFWQRWQKEYLAELQQRTKWRVDSSKLNVGDMVLLADENAPPLQWRLGRVLRLFPGPDGIARVADVNTTKGCVRRPFVRLCPLPTAEELQE